MMNRRAALRLMFLACVLACATSVAAASRWSEPQANDWYARQGFLVGANYLPATAINEMEMRLTTTTYNQLR